MLHVTTHNAKTARNIVLWATFTSYGQCWNLSNSKNPTKLESQQENKNMLILLQFSLSNNSSKVNLAVYSVSYSVLFAHLESTSPLFYQIFLQFLVASAFVLNHAEKCLHRCQHHLLFVLSRFLVFAQPIGQVCVKRGLVEGRWNGSTHELIQFIPEISDTSCRIKIKSNTLNNLSKTKYKEGYLQ